MPKRIKPVYPMPEAIDGKRWTVKRGQPRIDTTAREMFVPLGATDADRFLRAHESAHARITPKVAANAAAQKAGVSIMALQVAEDARVHAFLNRRGIPTPGALTEAEIAQGTPRIAASDRDAAGALLAAVGTGDYARIYNALALAPGMEPARLDSIVQAVRQIAQMIAAKPARRNARHPVDTTMGFKQRTVPAAQLFESMFPEAPTESDRANREMIRRAVARSPVDDTSHWGDVQPIGRAPLTLGKRAGRGVTRSFRDEGTIPSAVYRLPVDGRVFTRSRKAVGGTVLVDASGSMELDSNDLAAIVDAAPAGRVAIYCGAKYCGGRVTIVADNGRRAADRDIQAARIGGCNLIDGPALKWLARQPGPRIWVSDGLVNGHDGRIAHNLLRECADLCRRHGIRRVDRPHEAADLLRPQPAGK